MTKKSRYFLLAACILVFLVLAPLIVLYVRGAVFDFQTRDFVATGILSVRSVPSDASVYLDGKLARNSAGDLRFVLPGQHQLTLKRAGYSDWTKRLNVQSGQVTWANSAFGSIYLLLSQPPAVTMATSAADFYSQNGRTIYLNKDFLSIIPAGAATATREFLLPGPLTAIVAADQSGNNFLLAAPGNTNIELLNTGSGAFTNLSRLFGPKAVFEFDDSGQLYALDNGTLYSVSADFQTKTALFDEVKTFAPRDGLLYFISQPTSTPPELDISQAPFIQSQPLLGNLPAFTRGALYVTSQKQIFLLADGQLYLLNSAMLPLAGNVTSSVFDPQTSILAALHSGELDYFDPLSGSLDFVTRSSASISDFTINPAIGYAFFQTNNQIEALELDTRDRQNQYTLYAGSDIKKIALDPSGKVLTVLDGTTLKNLVIR